MGTERNRWPRLLPSVFGFLRFSEVDNLRHKLKLKTHYTPKELGLGRGKEIARARDRVSTTRVGWG